MKEISFYSQILLPLIKLTPQNSYQLLFIISNTLYHSYDFFFNGCLTQTQGIIQVVNIFSIFKINPVSIIFNLIIIKKIFINKEQNYLIQIQQRIIFPILLLILTQVFINSKSNEVYKNIGQKICIQIGFAISTIFSLVLICIKNFKLNLRYQQSLQKGLNRIFTTQYFLLLLKLGAIFIFSVFLPNQKLINYVIICGFNILFNYLFTIKIFYDHPCIQYLSMITQFYIWVPSICGILQYNGFNLASLWILYFVGFMTYLFMSLYKPKIIMFYLQQKYLQKITHINNFIKNLNNKQSSQLKNFDQPLICYLAISRSIIIENDKNQIKWSTNFFAQILRILNSNTISLKTKFQYDKINQFESINEQKHINQTQISLSDDTQAFSVQFYFDSDGRISQKLRVVVFSLINSLISELLFKMNECPNTVRLYVCHNFLDTTNKMRHLLFYSYFLGVQKNRNYFDQVNSELCYKYLLSKLGMQQSRTIQNKMSSLSNSSTGIGSHIINKNNHQNIQQSGLNKKRNSLNILISDKIQYCLIQSPYYFNSLFNDLTQQHSLYHTVLQGFQEFINNQKYYVNILSSANQNKSQIRQYFRKRNDIRKQIQFTIQKYCNLQSNSKRFYILIIFNYIKNFFLRQDPLVAYDYFAETLQNQTQNHHFHKSNDILSQNTDLLNVSNKINCVISGIQDPDTIMICCSQFKRLLQIQNQRKFSHLKTKSTKNIKIKKSYEDQTNYKLKLNTFILPLWRQQHETITSNKFMDQPIDHLLKRYFLISKKQTNILQIKFKMNFHMMYQKDLLIILDIDQYSLSNLQIWNKQKDNLLFSHNKQNPHSKVSIYSQFGIRKPLNSILDDSMRQKISQVNQFVLTNKPNKQSQTISLFGLNYHIISKISSEQNALLSKMIQIQAKSVINFQSLFQQDQKHQFQRQKQIKQLKFHKFKSKFTFQKPFLAIIVLFNIGFIIVVIFLLAMYYKQQSDILKILISDIDDKILVEDQYVKNQFSRTVDAGMLSNIFQKQLNLLLIGNSQKLALFSHILASIKQTLKATKNRHSVHSYQARQGIRLEGFLDYNWVPTYNISFQFTVFRGQMKYVDCLKSFINITEKVTPISNSKFSNRQMVLAVNLPKTIFPQIKTYINSLYLRTALGQKDYIFNQVKGVFTNYKNQQKGLFNELKNYQLANFCIFEITIAAFSLVNVILVYLLINRMIQKYKVTLNISNKFYKTFKSNYQQLNICTQQLTKFSKQTLFQIIKPKKIDYQQLIEKKSYTVKSITVSKYASRIMNENMPKQSFNDHLFSKFKVFKAYYFTRIIFPLLKLFILILLFFEAFQQGRLNTQQLLTYSTGLTKLSYVSLALLDLATTNLFLSNYRVFQISASSSYTVQTLINQFTDTISKVSTMDKIEIINNMLVKDPQREQLSQKILYRSLCSQFPQTQCPQYMIPHINGLYQKYGQVIKNINVLFLHLVAGKITPLGTINTTLFQNLYIQSYQSLSQLLYVTKRIKIVTLNRLKSTLPVNSEGYNGLNEYFPLFLCLSIYLIIDGIIMIVKLYSEARVIEQQFLRIGNYSMFESEKQLFDGYHKYVNQAQYQWVPINE